MIQPLSLPVMKQKSAREIKCLVYSAQAGGAVRAGVQAVPGLQRAVSHNAPWRFCSTTADFWGMKQETNTVTKLPLFLSFSFYIVQSGIEFLHLFIVMSLILKYFLTKFW